MFRNKFVITSEESILFSHKKIIGLDLVASKKAIEGFGGKRALGFLLKSELCQKRSKFRMQLCLGVFSNVLHVFCLKFASFLRYY